MADPLALAGGGGGGAPNAPSSAADFTPVCGCKTWFGRTANVFAEMSAQVATGTTGAALPVERLTAASRIMAESYGPLPPIFVPRASPPPHFFAPPPISALTPSPRSSNPSFSVPPAYMFGAGGMVTGVLNKDLEDNTGGFEKAAKRVRDAAAAAGAPSPATALDVFLAELAARPLAELRKDRKTGAVVCGLWMSRALLFVGRFGSRLILTPGATPTEVAKAVYTEVLRPYHGMIIAGVVSMAFSLAPSRVGGSCYGSSALRFPTSGSSPLPFSLTTPIHTPPPQIFSSAWAP